MDVSELTKKAVWLRREVLRSIYESKRGHIGGTYSCAELLVALYYGGILRFYPEHPRHELRDRFICKGQPSLALYHIWVDLGILERSRLEEYGTDGSRLGAELNIDTPGAEYDTGSLGNLLGVGAGMALAAKLDNKSYKTVVLMGDGECDEGSVWEAAMFASRQELNNMVAIVDRNHLSVMDYVEEDKSGSLEDKFRVCGWECEVIDGHNFDHIFDAFSRMGNNVKPFAIIADTIKGKGVSFMENEFKWHHSVPGQQEYDRAMQELGTVL